MTDEPEAGLTSRSRGRRTAPAGRGSPSSGPTRRTCAVTPRWFPHALPRAPNRFPPPTPFTRHHPRSAADPEAGSRRRGQRRHSRERLLSRANDHARRAGERLPGAESTAVSLPPDTATAIAVRADPALVPRLGYGNGTVVIVLDCSGSMRPPVVPKSPPPYPDETLAVNAPEGLFDDAAKSLESILNQLPPGTVVTIRTFGRRSSARPRPRARSRRCCRQRPGVRSLDGTHAGDGRSERRHHRRPVARVADRPRRRRCQGWLRSHPEYPGPFKSVVLIWTRTRTA